MKNVPSERRGLILKFYSRTWGAAEPQYRTSLLQRKSANYTFNNETINICLNENSGSS